MSNKAPIERRIARVQKFIAKTLDLADRQEAMLDDAKAWILAACREHPELIPPGWCAE